MSEPQLSAPVVQQTEHAQDLTVVPQGITAAVQTVSLVLTELGLRAVRLPPVPAAAFCTPARAAIPAPAVRQREYAQDPSAPEQAAHRLPLLPKQHHAVPGIT